MFGPFNDPRVAVTIGNVFGDASGRVHDQRQRSMMRHERAGTSERNEVSDTDDLIDDFEKAILQGLDSLKTSLMSSGIDLDIEFYPTNVAAEEPITGADFGVRLHIRTNSYNVSKGVLFQCKRMHGGLSAPTFKQLRGDGQKQAEDMLRLTPASFFLLFNGLPVRQVLQWMSPFAATYPWHPIVDFIAESDRFPLWNTGIMVLPASRVFAESRVCNRDGAKLPIEAAHWCAGAIPFGLFMADLFGSCFVGDVRDTLLRIVTPPNIRDISTEGVPSIDASALPIRRLLNIVVERRSP